MKQSIRKLMTLLLLFTCSIGAWADDPTLDDGGLALKHNFGDKATVTFYPYTDLVNGEKPTAETINSLKNTNGISNIGDCDYIVAHVVPATGYWTNEALLNARLISSESILKPNVNQQVPVQVAQSRTRGTDIAGGIEVTLILLDEGRNDGAGWYYYEFPEEGMERDLASMNLLYESLLLDGYVLPKFDLSKATASTDRLTYTMTDGDWTTTLTIDEGKNSFEYNGSEQGPTKLTNTRIVVKRFDTDKNEYVEAVKFDAEGDVAKHVTASVSAKTGSSLNADEAIDAGSYALTIKAASAEAVVVNGANTRGSSEAIVGSGIFTNSKDVDFTITQKEVEIVPTVNNKVYDGTKNATIASATIETGIDGEALKYVSGLTAEFEDANVGTGKRVDVTGTPKVEKGNDNTNVANYTFTVAEDVKANITAKTIKDDPNAQNGEGAITIVLDPTEYTYDKTEKKPAVTVKDGETTVAATEYNVAYKDNVNAGTATVTITDKDGGNYNVSGTKTFTIKQAALTITADAKSKVFGAKDPELTYKAEGLAKGDELTGALARAEGENVGEYDITQGKLSAGDNYTIAFTGAKLKITAKTIKDDPDAQNGEGAITIVLDPTEYTYDKTEKKPTVTVKDGETTVAASEYKIAYKDNINAGTATVTITDSEGGNYTVSGTKTFTIKKAALTITAEAQTKVAGAEDPELTYTAEGLVEDDQLTGALTRAEGEDVGEYDITQGTLEASDNYTITFTGAKLTITSASFAEDDVKAEGYEGIYDGKPHTITVTAPKSATVQYGKTEGTYGNEAPTYTNVGEYTVYYQVTMANTNPVTGNKKVVIKKAALTITADAKTKVEGEDDPELTYTTKGLVEGDKLEGALTREAGEKAGTYDILQGTLKANDNYKVSFVGAKLTITAKPAPPTPTVKTYTVSVVQTGGGTVNVSHTEAKAGEQVNMIITPDEKYYLESLTVAKAKGGSVQYYDTEDGKGNSYKSFKMPEADVIVTVAFGTYETPEKKQNIFIFKVNYGEVISNKLYADGEKQEQVNLKAKTVKGYEHCILDELFVYNEKFEPLPISSTMTEEEGLIYHFVMRGEKAFVYNTFKGTNNIVDESQALPPDYSLYLFNNIYDHFFNLSKGAEGVQLAMSLVANILATFTPEEKLQLKQGDDDVRMRIINSKMGWLIKFDYIGALRALNPGLFKLVGLNTRGTEEGTPLDSDGTILSGAYYRVLEDTDLDFLLESTTGPLLIESISVIAPEDDDPTGISRLKADEADTDIYDLRGRKVDSTNLRKGVYIKNGHKVVIK